MSWLELPRSLGVASGRKAASSMTCTWGLGIIDESWLRLNGFRGLSCPEPPASWRILKDLECRSYPSKSLWAENVELDTEEQALRELRCLSATRWGLTVGVRFRPAGAVYLPESAQ
jgi:hypothetical protein